MKNANDTQEHDDNFLEWADEADDETTDDEYFDDEEGFDTDDLEELDSIDDDYNELDYDG